MSVSRGDKMFSQAGPGRKFSHKQISLELAM